MKSLVIICLGLYGSWHFMDIESDNMFYAAICPILFFIFLISGMIWLVTRGGVSGRTSDRSSGYGGFFDGGDGGCGD